MQFDDEYYAKIISRSGSFQLLDDFIKNKLKYYSQKRNFDLGISSKNYVSGLSPAVTRRTILIEEIISEISKYFQYRQVEKFIDELCWRVYWKGWLEYHPIVWDKYLDQLSICENQISDLKNYQNAISANTGIDCFDCWVKDLINYGYLHNHTRMWFASIWIYYLELPWQLGAQLFYKYLIDADAASNTLSWRWVAGLQTKGKTYVTSQYNIDKFTVGRFRFPKNFTLSSKEVPKFHKYYPKDFFKKNIDINGKKVGQLIYEEDLSLKLVKKGIPTAFQKKKHNVLNQSSLPVDLTNRSLNDTLERFKIEFKNNFILFDWNNPKTLADWVKSNKIEVVRLTAPGVGPFKKLIPEIFENLEVQVFYDYHQIDLALWKFSDKGFFKLKNKIKDVVRPFWKEPLFQ
tara:strand:+ start:529 stop:1737 length:1209 start_codon:yes stop_codon:yes gene_type:complete